MQAERDEQTDVKADDGLAELLEDDEHQGAMAAVKDVLDRVAAGDFIGPSAIDGDMAKVTPSIAAVAEASRREQCHTGAM